MNSRSSKLKGDQVHGYEAFTQYLTMSPGPGRISSCVPRTNTLLKLPIDQGQKTKR